MSTHILTVSAVISMMVSQNARLEMTPVGAVSASWQEKHKTHMVQCHQTFSKHSSYKAMYCVYHMLTQKNLETNYMRDQLSKPLTKLVMGEKFLISND